MGRRGLAPLHCSPPSTTVTILSGCSLRAKAAFTFVIAWHVPGLHWESLEFIPDVRKLRRHYATRFANAAEVVHHEHTQREFSVGAE